MGDVCVCVEVIIGRRVWDGESKCACPASEHESFLSFPFTPLPCFPREDVDPLGVFFSCVVCVLASKTFVCLLCCDSVVGPACRVGSRLRGM